MIKKLARSVREYKTFAILTPLFISLEVAMEVVIPRLLAVMIDNGVEKGNMGVIYRQGAIILICALVSLLGGALSARFGAVASTGFAKNLRHDVFRNVQNFSFDNIDQFSTSSIVTRLTTDINNVQMAFQMIIRIAVRSPFMLIFSVVMAISINAKVAWIFIVALPLLAVIVFSLATKAHPIFEKVFKSYDEMNRVVQENVRGIRVVKAFVREEYENKKFRDSSDRIYQLYIKVEKMMAFMSPVMQMVSYLSMLAVCWMGAHLIVGGSMGKGELMSLMTYTMQILASLMMLHMIFIMIIISRASAERVCELLDTKSNIVSPEDPVTEVKDGSIRFHDVDFKYHSESGGYDKNDPKSRDQLALKDVTLDIRSGEVIGIIGGTGSSKSTMVQLIPRLYDVTQGYIEVGGVDVRDYDLNVLRNSVAMVLQKNELFSGTIAENLRWGNENATQEEIEEAARIAQADDFIREFPDGYETHIEQGGTNVSGGQKQRLCIARALLKKPKIIIMDDSTSAVDTKTDKRIREAFRKAIPETTKIIIAQRIASVQDADRIIVMDNGRINGIGTHEELIQSNDIYREVYESQQEGDGDFDKAE